MEEDEVDVLGDFCLNLETDLNHYDAGEFPTQNSELLGDYMQHPWLLDNSQAWYFDHTNEEKNKNVLESMLHEEKKHFPGGSLQTNVQPSPATVLNVPKVSPMWTKDDVDSLRKGIELYSQNWSKVARTVGTKTTLQVKSYIKSHPELVSNPAVYLHSSTPSPPQFVNEVEVTNEEPVVQFSVEELVNDAEIPASMEEVIASVTTNQWGWPSNKNKKEIRSKKKSLSKYHGREKNSLLIKKGPGRPRKFPKDPNSLPSTSNVISKECVPLLVPKPAPVLLGEVVRLQRASELVDTQSDSEVDIDCSDDEIERLVHKPKIIVKEEPQPQLSPVQCDASSDKQDPEKLERPPISDIVLVENGYKSECESSETDSKYSKDPQTKIPEDASEPPQPIFTFSAPVQERIVDLAIITDEEKTIHWDFFEGRTSKTPERYIKIRNSIIGEWRRVKPRYLTKTSVRPSLKNCGDVNCISRVHAYLELTGAINFGCEQVQYNRPLPPVPSHRERLANSGVPHVNHHTLISGLPARARKKRAHPSENSDENGGYTISHDGSQLYTSSLPKPKPKRKIKVQPDDQSNPFKLVPCINFGSDKLAPFQVKLSMQALLIIDIHSHLFTTEVIGLLGGRFYSGSDNSQATLLIEAAQPCRSQATNHQCEMCPVSQTEASEELRSRGLEIVGWYHSHPTFPALPSLRDLHTQNEFQQWFSRQEAPFVGLIVNPFSSSGIKASMSIKSMIRCITVHDDLPYKHDLTICDETGYLDEVKNTLNALESSLDVCPTLVPLNRKYPYYLSGRTEDGVMNYAKKTILSLRAHLEKAVSTDTLSEVEILAESFLKKVMLRHADKVTVVPCLDEHSAI